MTYIFSCVYGIYHIIILYIAQTLVVLSLSFKIVICVFVPPFRDILEKHENAALWGKHKNHGTDSSTACSSIRLERILINSDWLCQKLWLRDKRLFSLFALNHRYLFSVSRKDSVANEPSCPFWNEQNGHLSLYRISHFFFIFNAISAHRHAISNGELRN